MNARHRTCLSVGLITSLVVACHPGGGSTDPAEAETARQAALAPREVRLVLPELREERPSIKVVGEIRTFDSVEVSPEVAGRVDAVRAEVGDRVRAGQPLAEVDRATFKIYLDQSEAELAAARANLDLATKELERKRDLLADSTIAQATFDQAKATYDLAVARGAAAAAARDLAQRNWERSIMRAPAAGVITERIVVAGQWTDVGQKLFELAIGDTVKVVARVPSAWAPRLAGLDGFDFTVASTDRSKHAKLYSIDPVVNESSRSFEVVGVTPNPTGDLRPGMFAEVTLESPETIHSLWLPASAVSTSDMSQVMTVADGAIALHRVQIGRRSDGFIEIVDGLEEGDPVVADVAGLHRGASVTIVGEGSDPSS